MILAGMDTSDGSRTGALRPDAERLKITINAF